MWIIVRRQFLKTHVFLCETKDHLPRKVTPIFVWLIGFCVCVFVVVYFWWQCHHFVQPLVLSCLDVCWLCPCVLRPGWMHRHLHALLTCLSYHKVNWGAWISNSHMPSESATTVPRRPVVTSFSFIKVWGFSLFFKAFVFKIGCIWQLHVFFSNFQIYLL